MNTFFANRTRLLIAGTMISLVTIAFAAEQAPPEGSEPSKQAREQMAKMHEEMAACLRSAKSFAACQTQTHERCMTTMGDKGCPMMGSGMQQHRHRD